MRVPNIIRRNLAVPPKEWPRSTTVEVTVVRHCWDGWVQQHDLQYEQGNLPVDDDFDENWDRLDSEIEALERDAHNVFWYARQAADSACWFAEKPQATWIIEGHEISPNGRSVRLTVGVYFGEDISGMYQWWEDPMLWPVRVRRVKRLLRFR